MLTGLRPGKAALMGLMARGILRRWCGRKLLQRRDKAREMGLKPKGKGPYAAVINHTLTHHETANQKGG